MPAGDYVYTVHAGAFPDGSVTSASFPITKAAGALAVRADDGAWEATGWDDAAPAASASEAASEAPAALALSAPAPHPFRGAARIALSVPAAQTVRVGVYDALGREVAVLHDGPLAAGTHVLALDGRGLAAGVYVVRAEGTGGVALRRVVRY
ncbi:MAG TPA: T9SS type A sorting domain-containing protein [Rubricoccaceae bacterium]|nr:T9SS type A sorting domain-containing protein [Rubricoccaceae bacterium]